MDTKQRGATVTPQPQYVLIKGQLHERRADGSLVRLVTVYDANGVHRYERRDETKEGKK